MSTRKPLGKSWTPICAKTTLEVFISHGNNEAIFRLVCWRKKKATDTKTRNKIMGIFFFFLIPTNIYRIKSEITLVQRAFELLMECQTFSIKCFSLILCVCVYALEQQLEYMLEMGKGNKIGMKTSHHSI